MDLHVPQPADCLPQAALLAAGSVCVHGGLELKAVAVTTERKWEVGRQKKYPLLFLELTQNSCQAGGVVLQKGERRFLLQVSLMQ